MKHAAFEISNYKGIQNASVDLGKPPRGNVYTFVGLNESGKTTSSAHLARYV